ncbi:HK97 gp10 family phage protein [Nocardioides sp. J2M5]|uniref:HK97 gp10 family phage protein n=1 Tax=Nocardioides palaemonis TaxID=2829810 RepID=UPI001BABB6F8|nr:HK97 gp10 family phage protein [Nocardioides palaemonis]MBS2939589.1 HK97 gp10 family phage protein [Nocardioides palaemonis]
MGVYVEGLRETTRALEKAGIDVEELKDAMAAVAAEAADVMQGYVPVGRTGNLRASVRGNRAKGRAIVTAGKARVPYAGPIQYGWARRNIKPAKFVERTDAVMDDRAPQILEQGWADIATRNGLA